MNFHLSIKFLPKRKFTNGNITLIGRMRKLKMKEQCDKILKQYGVSGCTDFSFPLKSEQPVSVKPPTLIRTLLGLINPYGILDDP